jgi:hypothetical protein
VQSTPIWVEGLGGLPVHVRRRAKLSSDKVFGVESSIPRIGEDGRCLHEAQHVGGNDLSGRENHGPVRLGSDQVAGMGTVADLGQIHAAALVELDENIVAGVVAHNVNYTAPRGPQPGKGFGGNTLNGPTLGLG